MVNRQRTDIISVRFIRNIQWLNHEVIYHNHRQYCLTKSADIFLSWVKNEVERPSDSRGHSEKPAKNILLAELSALKTESEAAEESFKSMIDQLKALMDLVSI